MDGRGIWRITFLTAKRGNYQTGGSGSLTEGTWEQEIAASVLPYGMLCSLQ